MSEGPVDEIPWIMDFDSIVAAIVLELGTDVTNGQLFPHGVVKAALRKYYRETCFWEFESVADVMAEQICRVIWDDYSPF